MISTFYFPNALTGNKLANLHCISKLLNFGIICARQIHNECLSHDENKNKPSVRAPSGRDRVFLWTKESSSSPASLA